MSALTVGELSKMLETAKALGYGDSQVHIDDSRDGQKSSYPAKAIFTTSGPQMDRQTRLIMGRDNASR